MGRTGVSFGFKLRCVVMATAALLAGQAVAVVGGNPGGPLEASAVMVLHDRGGFCTGSVLTRDVILTAAHCVPSGAQIRVHYRDGGQPVLLETLAVVRHPEFRPKAVQERTRSIDMALIRLKAPLPARFDTVVLNSNASEGAVVVAGFGLSREGDAATAGTWRSASLQVTQPFGPSRVLLWARSAAGGGACQGDSGGPLTDASGTIVAVTSWSTGKNASRCGDLTQGVLVGSQRGWIDTTLARWAQQASWR